MRWATTLRCGLVGMLAALLPQSQAAGLRLIDIPATDSIPVLNAAVWSPCARPAVAKRVQAFLVNASRNCPVEGEKLPLIVISHGFTGSLYGHHDTAEALADHGFLVVSLNHTGDSGASMKYPWEMRAFEQRPVEIRRVIDYMLDEAPEASRIDPSRIGVFGFSRGDFTALVAAGGTPDFARSGLRCPKDRPLCRQIETEAGIARDWAHDERINAAAAVDPLNAFPDAASLRRIRIPLFLWISERGGDGVEPAAEARLRGWLPTVRNYRVVPKAGHFAFLAPCVEAAAKEAPEICRDAPGFDRAAFHRKMNAELLDFFNQALDIKP